MTVKELIRLLKQYDRSCTTIAELHLNTLDNVYEIRLSVKKGKELSAPIAKTQLGHGNALFDFDDASD